MMRFSEEVWDAIDAVLIELDQRLQQRPDASFDDLVPDLDAPYRIELLAEMVKLHQEYAWKAGARRRIEEYIETWPELGEDTAVVATLLRSECQTRMHHGETVGPQELEQRFPDVCEQIGVETLLMREAHELTQDVTFQVSDECLESIRTGEWYRRSQTPPKALAPGTMLGRYSILSVLGRGGMATVYLAQDEELDRAVAVKVLHRQFFSQPEVDKNLLRRDARAAARLRHPAVVPVYDICSDDAGQPFIVMEYVNGESLQRRMMREPIDVVDAVDIAGQVAGTLAAAHRVDLIHRDIKPGNILLDESGRVRVSDFGLAVQLQERDNFAHECGGTIPYMAPEQIRGQIQQQDGRTDVWALGVVLYEMLTGERPFRGDDRPTIGKAILHDPVASPRDVNRSIPAPVADLCLRCLEKDVEKRNITAAELEDELEDAKLRLLRPSRAKRFAGLLLVLVAVFAAVWFGTRERPWEPPQTGVAQIPLHPWMNDCKLVLVADTGAKIDPAELHDFVDLSPEVFIEGGLLTFDTFYRDPVIKSLRIEGEWVLWEIPLSFSWSKSYRDHQGRVESKTSLVGPSSTTLRLRYAVRADGVFQIGTVSDRTSEHLAALLPRGGIANYRTFGHRILRQNQVGEPKDSVLETNERQNLLASRFGQAYDLLYDNGIVRSGPADFFDLYQCPLEVRNFFSFPVTVVTAHLLHEQFDYRFAEAGRYIREKWNRTWSPIAEDPDQEADLSIAVNLRAPADRPSLLVVEAGNDNGNESRFRVEGLAFSMPDQMAVQAPAGEAVSYVRTAKEEGVATGFVHDVAGAIVWLYDEVPTRIVLESHSVESIVKPNWSFVCGGQVAIESTEVSPAPGGGRQIAPRTWVLPPREAKPAKRAF